MPGPAPATAPVAPPGASAPAPWLDYRSVFTNAKAGMEGVDKEHVQRVVYEMSKDSAHYRNEQRKQAQVDARIAKLRERSEHLTPAELAAATRSKLFIPSSHSRAAQKQVPMAVGGMGMISTANYVARRFGVRSAMPGFIGKRLCPQLVFVPLDFSRYQAAAERVRAVFRLFDPAFETGGLDEAALDVTEHCSREGCTGEQAAAELRRLVRETCGGLTCSVGVAANKMLAKADTSAEPGRKGISCERTFRNMSAPAQQEAMARQVRAVVRVVVRARLVESLAAEMAEEGIEGRNVTLKLKLATFEVCTRAVTLPRHMRTAADILPAVLRLLRNEMPLTLRLMGVRMAALRKRWPALDALRVNAAGSSPLARFLRPGSSSAGHPNSHPQQQQQEQQRPSTGPPGGSGRPGCASAPPPSSAAAAEAGMRPAAGSAATRTTEPGDSPPPREQAAAAAAARAAGAGPAASGGADGRAFGGFAAAVAAAAVGGAAGGGGWGGFMAPAVRGAEGGGRSRTPSPGRGGTLGLGLGLRPGDRYEDRYEDGYEDGDGLDEEVDEYGAQRLQHETACDEAAWACGDGYGRGGMMEGEEGEEGGADEGQQRGDDGDVVCIGDGAEGPHQAACAWGGVLVPEPHQGRGQQQPLGGVAEEGGCGGQGAAARWAGGGSREPGAGGDWAEGEAQQGQPPAKRPRLAQDWGTGDACGGADVSGAAAADLLELGHRGLGQQQQQQERRQWQQWQQQQGQQPWEPPSALDGGGCAVATAAAPAAAPAGASSTGPGAGAGAGGGMWACRVCTFASNRRQLLRCEVCDCLKGSTQAPPGPPPPAWASVAMPSAAAGGGGSEGGGGGGVCPEGQGRQRPCPECGADVDVPRWAEHQDWHLALRLCKEGMG
ncbi:DNA polymerase kappa [Tetrabaena socialis]|uniref:DNA-directed DNA polymerase n=1 Tax=Tetrabaena socialis TaxID=47790 RepID=A0A2J7ZRY8_9CHLO|nr:DNA polymerase kappa [Tetrabaena socialis]|eukprot:PNH03025.1 DNA polymerase kappa [Tetrabaena socialis]